MHPYIILFFTLSLVSLPGSVVALDRGKVPVEVERQSSKTLDEVQRKFEAGDFSEALVLLEGILSVDKNNAEAHAKTGAALIQMGRFNESVVHLERAVELESGNIEYNKSLAYSYESRFQYADAIRIYRSIIDLALPGAGEYAEAIKKITFLTATRLEKEGDAGKALHVFDQLAIKYPDDYLIRYNLGLSYFSLNIMDKALVEFREVIRLNPKYANTYLNLASIYESQGEMELAIESLETVIALDPESKQGKIAKKRLAVIEASWNPANKTAQALDEVQRYFEAGNLAGALSLLERLLAEDKNNAEAHAKAGVILVRMGQFHEGVEHLKRAVELAPENIAYYKSLAVSYEFKSQYDDAILNYKRVKELASVGSVDHELANKKIDFLIATKLARSGSVDKALPIFDRLVQKYPDDVSIRYSLGLSYFFLRRMDDAFAEFEKVIELNPKHANAYMNLASIYESRGEISQAIESLETVVSFDPESPTGKRAKERLGLIEANLIASSGNHQDALDILNDVINTNPDSIPALMLMGRSYAQLGKIESAEESYQKVLALAPNQLEAKSQLAGLYLMSKRVGLAIDLLEKIVIEGAGTKYAAEAEKTLKNISGESVFEKMSAEEKTEVIEAFLLDRISRNPEDIEAHFKLAQFYAQAQRKDEAYESISKAAALSPDSAQIFRIKGSLASDLGKFDEAISSYSRAIMLSSDLEKADAMASALRLAVARNSFNDGKLGIAEREFKEIITDNPDNVLAYFYLGLIYSREESFLKAVDSYENVVRLAPGNFGARLNLAGTFERLNQEEDAISEYRKILQENPDEKVANDVKARLFAAEKKIKGMTASMGYAMTYDDNSVADDAIVSASDEVRSNMSFNIAYQYKMQNGIRLRLSTSPTYSTYHKEQFDFLNTSNTLSATVTPGRYTMVGGYTKRTSKGLLTERRSSSADVLFAEIMTRAKFRKLYDIFSDEKVMTGFTLTSSKTNFDSASNNLFSALSYRLGGDISQNLDERSTVKLGYSYVRNDNTEILASDYAYRSHQLNLRLERRFKSGITGNVGYGYTISRYVNRDSFLQQYRKNSTHNLSGGVAYWMSRKIRLFANYAYVKTSSNLDITTTITGDQFFNQGLRAQSTSLGGSNRNSITAGFNLLF